MVFGPSFLLVSSMISLINWQVEVMDEDFGVGEKLDEIEVIERSEFEERRRYGAGWIDGETYSKVNLKPLSVVGLIQRGGFGVQEDVSIAGATFEQNLVLFEGLRITDLQTGHHLMNLPVSSFDVLGVEVMSGALSAVYGSGAFGGALNFHLTPSKKGLGLNIGMGSFDLREAQIRLGLPLDSKVFTFSLNHKTSSGHTNNRDFDIRLINIYHKEETNLIFYGFLEKDFGAKYFYTPRFDSEWESTRTHLLIYKRSFALGETLFEPGVIVRRNYDYYQLIRSNPQTYFNQHRSTLFRANLPLKIATRRGNLNVGVELSYESLVSSRLGSYLRRSISPYFSWETLNINKLQTLLTFRYDNNFREKDIVTVSSTFLYPLREWLNFRFSVFHTSRLPSVTELRYEAYGIRGNPNLLPEKALGTEFSFDVLKGKTRMRTFTLFRKGYNLIDWFNNGTGTIARNVDTDTIGLGFEVERVLGDHRMQISYTYLNLIGKDLIYSRYLGNYLRHNFQLGFSLNLPQGYRLHPSVSYEKRLGQDGKVFLNLYFEKSLSRNLLLYVWAKNLLNERYYEIKYHEAGRGVEGIPRWVGMGLKFGMRM